MAFTYFFRDLQTLELICEHSLPFLKTKQNIKIWNAGCAMGPESYTLAMLMREQIGSMYFRNVKIHATDVDESDLFGEIIEKGEYPYEQVSRIPTEYFSKYFIKGQGESMFQISKELKNSVKYRRHNLLTFKPAEKDVGLILCKNVLLHFSEWDRVEVIKMFHQSLIPGGFLAMEHTQRMPEKCSDLFEPVVANAKLFRKI